MFRLWRTLLNPRSWQWNQLRENGESSVTATNTEKPIEPSVSETKEHVVVEQQKELEVSSIVGPEASTKRGSEGHRDQRS